MAVNDATGASRGGRKRAPSMADVAALAGVSGQTVSRVANNRTNVDPRTRGKVLSAMRVLGYQPNVAARSLRTGRFGTIGAISFDLGQFGDAQTVKALQNAAGAAGYDLTLMSIASATQKAVRDAYDHLSLLAVDGLVLVQSQLLDTPVLQMRADLPMVIIAGDEHQRYPVVDIDQAEGVRLATEHLLSLGHRTVWHVAGPQYATSARKRIAGWHATLKAAGAHSPPVTYGDWSAESGYRAGLELAGRGDLTAIFAANDQMALGVLRALHECGQSVPGDVSVVGFDDTPDSACFIPPLTTIHQEFGQMGQRCVLSLLRQLEGERDSLPPLFQVPPRLVVRDSTAAPRS